MVLTLSLSLSLATEPRHISTTETYTLSDNHIIQYKGDFCEALRTVSISAPRNQQSTGYLYFLRSRPPLTERECFSAAVTASLISNNFRYWNFYLNAGSEASFKVCYQQQGRASRNVIFYVIRGTDRLNAWVEEPGGRGTEQTYHLTSECETIEYEVPQDGMHYFVFYLSSQGSFGAVNVDFVINRLLYDIQPDNIIHECSFALDGSSSCVLSAGMNTPYTAVLSLNASRPINYVEDGAEIHIGCQPRAWLYAIIVLAVVIIGPLICCGIAVCVKIVLEMTKKQPSATSRSSRVTNAVTSTTTTTTESNFTEPATDPNAAPPKYTTTESSFSNSVPADPAAAPPKYTTTEQSITNSNPSDPTAPPEYTAIESSSTDLYPTQTVPPEYPPPPPYS